MKPQYEKLLRILIEAQSSTAQTLADRLGVSVRSIKTYVHEINKEHQALIASSRTGYSVDSSRARAILHDDHKHIPQVSQERVVWIIRHLLNQENKKMNVYDICDELFISLSTLKNELTKVKRKTAKFDLTLRSQGDELYVEGLEKNKRKILSTILYDESNINFVNLKSLQHAFIDIDIEFIKNTVLQIFETYHYFINDYSLINLVLHITIAVDRLKHHNSNQEDITKMPAVRFHEYELASKVAEKMEEHFHIEYSKAEIYEMTLLIISRATAVDYKSITTSNLEAFIGKDCLDLVNLLIQDISSFYYIDLSEPEFFIRFALHIRNLLVRSKNNYFSKNPLTEGIKTACPFIYDISVSLAGILKEKTGVSINDDEIAYIAFHLGSTLEAQKNLTTKITAVLYCPNYYNINSKIIERINHAFSNDLLITNILTDESEFTNIKNTDFIISTMPIESVVPYPFLQISLFLREKDQEALRHKLHELRKMKKQREFESYLRELLTPQLFERKQQFSNKADCIHGMVKQLVKLGYVDPSFENEIFEREKMSSTAFGTFAIPHAMKMHAHKTGMCVYVSETGTLWDEHMVHLVIMLCFNKNERYIFNEIFDPLTMILSESEHVRKLVQCKDYEEFVQTLVSML